MAQSTPDSSLLRSEFKAAEALLAHSNVQQAALSDLRVINRQIDIQEQLLEVLTHDLTTYHNELEALQENMCLIEEGMDRLREEYIQTVRQTYRDFHPRSFWLSLLSSGSLTEAYYRSQYFREYSRYRKEQILLMQESKELLQTQLRRFERVWKRRGRLAQSRRSELARLRSTRRLKKSLYLNMRNKASQLRKDYHSRQQAIQQMIADAENPPSALVKDSMVIEADLGEQFSRSIGQLQWPVPPAQSIIVETFGVSKDEYGNLVENDGISLRVLKGQRVRSAFGGRVTGVRPIPMQGTAVIVEHGRYRTVYANLAATILKEGDFIQSGENLGVARTDRRTGETLVKFMIYRSPNTFLDPLNWLAH